VVPPFFGLVDSLEDRIETLAIFVVTVLLLLLFIEAAVLCVAGVVVAAGSAVDDGKE
jgi:hypothetical protein